MKKKLLVAFLLFLVLISGASCKPKNSEDVKNELSNELQFLKLDSKLTQEQVLSQIKADRLKKNKGYLDSDEVIAIMKLSDEALIDSYNEKYANSVLSIAEFTNTRAGKRMQERINKEQDKLIKQLIENDLILGVEHQYGTIINAVSVKTTYRNFKKLEQLDGVSKVMLSDTFNLPKVNDSVESQAVENVVDVYETGIFNSSSVTYTGNKTAVAVLDSGFDCSHSVFKHLPIEQMITKNDVDSILSKTRAFGYHEGLKLSDVYYNSKIPFVYDYADKDSDVFPYDSEHGTHVAGIIGGKDDVITGVAINTQLVLLKVFPDLNEGADTTDILAALEDAVLLGVDAINMSLGSSCGFTREKDGDVINDVYDKINESGVSLITAASNSYSSAFGGDQGNTNFVTNPDSSTVGSPSTYKPSLSVASISGVKSKYLVGNDSQIFFFKESNNMAGEPNDFLKELGIKKGETKEFEYVTVPGDGLKVNYATLGDLTGKIALVRRGKNSFEEKALNAKEAGAAACIIYNNIDGDILMSMGKTDHIPTISISKDEGLQLASKRKGTIVVSDNYQAGPFMSEFSSWGPTPSLELKPEITAHGGRIYSAIPGGGYDEMSGTSMATPNLCGIVVLIRQYIKEKFPDKTAKEVSILTNQLLMSTATIAKNEVGNPYSPRKQGAGLASLYNAVNTKAYITVKGTDKTKIELFDDPLRTGIYEMEFDVHNFSTKELKYDLSVIGMTESVSKYDKKHVAEKAQILDGITSYEVISGGEIDNKVLTIGKKSTAKVKVTYNLSNADKDLIDSLFPYGMYVEGFVKLKALQDGEIDLNVPFLAFYGDWTQAPMFDKTYYEVESEAHDASIDDEDKLKADYFATTPYGTYFTNYIIPLGTYLYDIDKTKYDEIPATIDHIAMSDYLGSIEGIDCMYTGLLRNAKAMRFTVIDKATGKVMYDKTEYNAHKAYSGGGGPMPYYKSLKLSSKELGLINNRQYEFKMEGLLDYGDGGKNTNVRNKFSFDFYLDNEAPILKDVQYEKEYDKNLRKDRYYMTMTIFDNHYVQSITPIIFNSSNSFTFLTPNPIPVYSERGKDNVVKFEITDLLDEIGYDRLITSSLAFSIDDYALNSNIYLCQLPGTEGEFKFTKDGTYEGTDLTILSMYEDEVVDLTKYLASKDPTLDDDKSYLKHLQWESSNDRVVEVKEGMVKALKEGRTTVTVKEQLNGKQAVLIINVKKRVAKASQEVVNTPSIMLSKNDSIIEDDYNDSKIKNVRFTYFNTIYAHKKAAQTSEIGKTGDRKFIAGMNQLSMYPGEKIQLFYDFDPWYAEGNYEVEFSSVNPTVATVDQNGNVTALKKGNTSIVLKVKGSNIMARIRLNVKSEFVIENRTLIAYKGLGGDVVIPDDEGLLYIGAYAFSLFDVDNSIPITEDDFDANKIPGGNNTVTSITIPEGVEEIKKYAFYNCTKLEKVVIPSTVKFIREFTFTNDKKLTTVNLANVKSIGASAFKGCKNLKYDSYNEQTKSYVDFNVDKIYAIGANCFEGCESLTHVNLSALRSTGKEAFKNCINLKDVIFTENTKLSYAMFVNSGVEVIDLHEWIEIPDFCFAKCKNLKTVNIHHDLVAIGKGAFSDCYNLTEFNILGNLEIIGEQAFYNSMALKSFTLPNCDVEILAYAFYKCSNLEELVLKQNTKLSNVLGTVFLETKLSKFTVDSNNEFYSAEAQFLLSKDGKTIIFASPVFNFGEYTLDAKYDVVGKSAFAGANITSLTILNNNLIIDSYAFANCPNLVKVVFPIDGNITVGPHAFDSAKVLETLENATSIKSIGDYGFSKTALRNVVLCDNLIAGEGAFFRSKLVQITLGANSKFGLGAFQECKELVTVTMPEAGNVHFGFACFANDTRLTHIDLTKVDSVIEDQTFFNCSALRSADLLNVKVIGEYAFSDCKALNYVNVPVIEEIKEGAFSRHEKYGGAPIFQTITLPATLRVIGDGAFIGCEGLEEITIPSSVSQINNYAFAYCLNLKSVKLPENIKTIGEFSFAGCKLLSTINLDKIHEIGKYAFTQAESLAKVNLSSVRVINEAAFAQTAVGGSFDLQYLTTVGNFAFQGASIVSFKADKLSTIGDAAFMNCYFLNEFTFSDKLSSFGVLVFNGCRGLMEFNVVKDGKEVNDAVINDYAKLVNGVLYTKLENGFDLLASIPTLLNVETLEVTEGTYRIERNAANENKSIKNIVLPDSLKAIGNYAFYGCENLKQVEFKSFTAPVLESTYNKDAVLKESDPGYEILKKYFDIFNFQLCYFNFIDLVGKKSPIEMILPNNEGIIGYDSIIYEVYFGKQENASRSDYEAKHKNMIDFVTLANKVTEIKTITLTDEKLINDAITAYNGVKQDPTKYGYTKEYWDSLAKTVFDAKEILWKLQLSNASIKAQNIQKELDNLNTEFNITRLEELKDLSTRIKELIPEERLLLDLTNYNKLVKSYNDYLTSLEVELTPVVSATSNAAIYVTISAIATISLTAACILAFKSRLFK